MDTFEQPTRRVPKHTLAYFVLQAVVGMLLTVEARRTYED
jgi:hypothetical protein